MLIFFFKFVNGAQESDFTSDFKLVYHSLYDSSLYPTSGYMYNSVFTFTEFIED
jgi:hypothetical protein